jgi:hypothetical protein
MDAENQKHKLFSFKKTIRVWIEKLGIASETVF